MDLLELLRRHAPFDAHEAAMTARCLAFVEKTGADAFGREIAGQNPECGHLTGSAWVVNADFTRVVLLFHGKLGRWVQPGGHCDEESDVLGVAQREVWEETGLKTEPVGDKIFDVDVHEIPEYWNTPAHLHFDVRFLLGADDLQLPVCSDESREVRWVSLEEAGNLSDEESIRRMLRKTLRLA